MRIARSLVEIAELLPTGVPHAVTLGNFDGVHVGHRELIRLTREKAASLGTSPVLVTFDPHPLQVLLGEAGPGIVTPLPRKLELFEKTGIDTVLVLPFTRETAAMSAEEFVKTVLAGALGVRDLVIGFNFSLGKNRSGNFTTLRALGERFAFSVTRVPPVTVAGETVSSTLIRKRINAGDMASAAALMGRMHSVDGTVVPGQARGRTLGYPTANINFSPMLLPPLGAYATWAQVLPGAGAPPSMSITSIGTNPTFGGSAVTLETHLLDFSGDLYGKRVRVYFAERLRGEIRFDGKDALVERLGRDAAEARAVLEREKALCCDGFSS